MEPTFEQYLRTHKDKSIDFTLRISESESGKISFYIHPANVDGETWDFEVEGNTLKLQPKTSPEDNETAA